VRPGVRIGIDVGQARVGVARTDPTPVLAVPLETIHRTPEDHDWKSVTARVSELVQEFAPIEVIVGLPLNLRGKETASTRSAVEFAENIAFVVHPVPVRLLDERLSTVAASDALRQSGVSSRGQKALIDQQAAVIILQQAIDMERSSGSPAGRQV
jgi:putative Holliday junction resolvase